MKESVFIGNMKYRRKNTKQSRPSSSTAFLECVIIDSPLSYTVYGAIILLVGVCSRSRSMSACVCNRESQ